MILLNYDTVFFVWLNSVFVWSVESFWYKHRRWLS